MAKKGKAKKPKDLDPKSRAKKVKGGRTTIGTQVRRIETRVGRGVQRIGRNVERTGLEAGRDIERTFNPPD
jgi:hypothetical protein